MRGSVVKPICKRHAAGLAAGGVGGAPLAAGHRPPVSPSGYSGFGGLFVCFFIVLLFPILQTNFIHVQHIEFGRQCNKINLNKVTHLSTSYTVNILMFFFAHICVIYIYLKFRSCSITQQFVHL